MLLLYILLGALLMSCISLLSGVAMLVGEEKLKQALLPLVALSAGSLLGAALFHLIPATSERFRNSPVGYAWVAGGFVFFFCLEQFMHWHHSHRATSHHHHPLTTLLLVADSVHNSVAGVAVGAAFVMDIRLGLTTWLVEAVHEVPHKVGDFGVLVYGGWSPRKALVYNFLTGLTFLVGALVAYGASSKIDVAYAVPFAAGNFLYFAAVDLVPEVNKHSKVATNILHFFCFLGGLALLLAVREGAH